MTEPMWVRTAHLRHDPRTTLLPRGAGWRSAMLVLARSVGQSVVLDDRITVTVLGSRGTLVRLGIEAAPDVGVRRGELAQLPPPPAATSTSETQVGVGSAAG